MKAISQKSRHSWIFKIFTYLILTVFLSNFIIPPANSYAQALSFPAPGAFMPSGSVYAPVLLKGMTVHPENPFRFDFVVDNGYSKLEGEGLKQESKKLVNYFLASMTVPQGDFWVNLNPKQPDKIAPEALGMTELGRDMLAQDYLLKQLTASLMHPEGELGRKLWEKIYRQAEEKYGTTDIPSDAFSRVWILPDSATIYENGATVYVVDAKMKVMLESDYASQTGDVQEHAAEASFDNGKAQLIREIILPAIEKEVNEGQYFAPLRQIYHSLILAKWYKQKVENSLLNQVYVDQNKIGGIDSVPSIAREEIYNQYLTAYKEGIYNYIKEEYDPESKQVIPRRYFSGGVSDGAMVVKVTDSARMIKNSVDGKLSDMEVDLTGLGPGDQAMAGKSTRLGKFVKILGASVIISGLICSGCSEDIVLPDLDGGENVETQLSVQDYINIVRDVKRSWEERVEAAQILFNGRNTKEGYEDGVAIAIEALVVPLINALPSDDASGKLIELGEIAINPLEEYIFNIDVDIESRTSAADVLADLYAFYGMPENGSIESLIFNLYSENWDDQVAAAQELFESENEKGIALAQNDLVWPRILTLGYPSTSDVELEQLGLISVGPLMKYLSDNPRQPGDYKASEVEILLGEIGPYDLVIDTLLFSAHLTHIDYELTTFFNPQRALKDLFERQTLEKLIDLLDYDNYQDDDLGRGILIRAYAAYQLSLEAEKSIFNGGETVDRSRTKALTDALIKALNDPYYKVVVYAANGLGSLSRATRSDAFGAARAKEIWDILVSMRTDAYHRFQILSQQYDVDTAIYEAYKKIEENYPSVKDSAMVASSRRNFLKTAAVAGVGAAVLAPGLLSAGARSLIGDLSPEEFLSSRLQLENLEEIKGEKEDRKARRRFLRAVRAQNIKRAKKFIDMVDQETKNQSLVEASWMFEQPEDYLPVAKFLFDNGADINAYYNGITALLGQAGNGSPEGIKFLLDRGADPRLTEDSKFNETVLMFAFCKGALKFLKNGKSQMAQDREYYGNIEAFLSYEYKDEKGNVDKEKTREMREEIYFQTNKYGETALIWAASWGLDKKIKRFIDDGKKYFGEERVKEYINQVTAHTHRTALIQAVISSADVGKDTDLVEFLLKEEADPTIKDYRQKTALEYVKPLQRRQRIILEKAEKSYIEEQKNKDKAMTAGAFIKGQKDFISPYISDQAMTGQKINRRRFITFSGVSMGAVLLTLMPLSLAIFQSCEDEFWPEPEMYEDIMQGLREGNWTFVHRYGWEQGALRAFRDTLRNPNASDESRIYSAHFLGEFATLPASEGGRENYEKLEVNAEEAVNILISVFHDEENVYKYTQEHKDAAKEGIEKLFKRRSIKIRLSYLMNYDNDANARAAVVYSLWPYFMNKDRDKNNDRYLIEQFKKVLLEDADNPEVRIRICHVLRSNGVIIDERDEEFFIHVLNTDPNRFVKALAMFLLMDIGSKKAIEPIIALFKNRSSNWNLRWWAAYVLGQIGSSEDQKVMDALKDAKDNDPDRDVRKAAEDAINTLLSLSTKSAAIKQGSGVYVDLEQQYLESLQKELKFMPEYGKTDRKKFSKEFIMLEEVIGMIQRRIKLLQGDQAMMGVVDNTSIVEAPGGIDMNKIEFDVTGNGEKIIFDRGGFDPLFNGDVKGFVPVIIQMTPINDLLPVLGLADEVDESESGAGSMNAGKEA